MHQIVLGVTGHLHGIGVQRVVIKEALKDVVQAVAQNVVQQDHWLAATRGFRRQIHKAWNLVRRNFQQRITNGVAANNFDRQIGVVILQELYQIRFAVN